MKRDGLELASLIGDGESVDWLELEQTTRDGDELARLRSLRQIAQIAELHRTFQAEGQPEGPDEPPPSRFAGMRVIEGIGSGSFADVYRARDEQVGRDVALKILRRRQPGETDEGEIVREAHLLAQVRHPNVAVVYGADRSDGKTGIWMELVEGETLEKKLRRDGPLPWREVARIGIDLCRALGAVHDEFGSPRRESPERHALQGRSCRPYRFRRGPARDRDRFGLWRCFRYPPLHGARALP